MYNFYDTETGVAGKKERIFWYVQKRETGRAAQASSPSIKVAEQSVICSL
jgi:hypothetical protein